MTSSAGLRGENFTKAQLLETVYELHSGNLAIGCNLGLTRYQQGRRDDARAARRTCGVAQEGSGAAGAGLAPSTGDRASVASPGSKPQVATQRRDSARATRTLQTTMIRMR
jgi:hypothetical protein